MLEICYLCKQIFDDEFPGASDETNSGETNSGETNSGETNSGETNSGETNSGETNSGETNSGGAKYLAVCGECANKLLFENLDNDSPGGGSTTEGGSNQNTGPLFTYGSGITSRIDTWYRHLKRGNYLYNGILGKVCVVKWFKPKFKLSGDHFYNPYHMNTTQKAQEIISNWNRLGPNGSKRLGANIVLVKSQVHTFEADEGDDHKVGDRVLVEDFIPGCQKFNSSTGWMNLKTVLLSEEDEHLSRTMQALTHYSYHLTNGEYVLSDLQGAMINGSVLLSLPVVNSKNREFGLTDMGLRGIRSVLIRHVCQKDYCDPKWMDWLPSPGVEKEDQGTFMKRLRS